MSNDEKVVLQAAIKSIEAALSADPPRDWRDSLGDAVDALGGLLNPYGKSRS